MKVSYQESEFHALESSLRLRELNEVVEHAVLFVALNREKNEREATKITQPRSNDVERITKAPTN